MRPVPTVSVTIAVPDRSPLAWAPSWPATAAEMTTKVSALSRWATPSPMPAPVMAAATRPSMTATSPAVPGRKAPAWLRIVPMMRVANRPWAMPVRPSMKKRWDRSRSAVAGREALRVAVDGVGTSDGMGDSKSGKGGERAMGPAPECHDTWRVACRAAGPALTLVTPGRTEVSRASATARPPTAAPAGATRGVAGSARG